jgi:hypothetical protein
MRVDQKFGAIDLIRRKAAIDRKRCRNVWIGRAAEFGRLGQRRVGRNHDCRDAGGAALRARVGDRQP